MNIYIPIWLVWVIGLIIVIPTIIVISFLAFIGLQFLKVFDKGFRF